MTSTVLMNGSSAAVNRLETGVSIKAAFIFLAVFTLYFISRSPGLDEIDSVNFAMGVGHFNLWQHQPHPPGYPLYIFLGWLGVKLFSASPESALHFVSAFGGGLFVAAWFLLSRLQFNERLAWWVASCLTVTPVVWMTATKVLTDSLAAGLLSAEILAAICFLKSGRLIALFSASLLGAAAAGTRPQLILVVASILVTALWQRRAAARISILAMSALIGASLLWLVPMWYTQWRLRPEMAAGAVYPDLVYTFWKGRLHKPGMYLFAGDWSPQYLGLRFVDHILGWFGLGFGFLQSWTALTIGTVIVATAVAAYLIQRRENDDQRFWSFHAPWALVHIAIIFISLPATQRYYLVIYPLLLVALLRGFLRLPVPWNWSALALPALLLFIAIPNAIANHRDEAPPALMVDYLEKLYPPSARPRVVLLLSTRSKRHAEWYAPAFVTVNPIPAPNALPGITKNAAAVYTDDATVPLPPGWYRIPLAVFARSPVIYWKGHFMELYLVDRGNRL